MAADSVRERANAKLNLSLRVFPVGGDGYHDLESLIVEVAELWDDVTVRRSGRRSVYNRGLEQELPQEHNLAWKALDALEAEVGERLPPVAVEIHKRIPSQAGLGGGSSDAAATLRAIDALLGLELGAQRLERVAAGVGSDVPFFVRGGCQLARGRGERLSPASCPELQLAIVTPPIRLSTAAVYRAFDRLPSPEGEATLYRNDLWPAALGEAPRLGAVARALRSRGARNTFLCGSGSTLAGVFADTPTAEAAAAALSPSARLAQAVCVSATAP
jgi:4-diphosphocytidyl-2-C-methyl-D-erythritol kinase